jgi:Ulp1 family protease
MMMRTNLHMNQQDVIKYFIKVVRHYKDKEMLVIPINMGNHWVVLSISAKYNQVWYCDSSRLTDLITGDRSIHD